MVPVALLLYLVTGPSPTEALTIEPRQVNTTSPRTSPFSATTGLEYATSCIWSKLDWANNGGSRYASETVIITSNVWTNTREFPSFQTVTSLTNSTPYSLCDGWPRMHGTTSLIKHSSPSIDVWTSSYITTTDVHTAYPAPNCTIAKSDCDILYASWTSEERSYNATISAYSSYVASANLASIVPTLQRPVRSYISPICGSPTTHVPQKTSSAQCLIASATAQLLYWPVEKLTRESCQGSTSLVTMEPTLPGKPNTAKYWDTILTSPTVYIALQGTWQLASSGTTYSDQSRIILPQEPSAVSSLCGTLGGGSYVSYSVDYADLQKDPPASAYRCQPRCFTHSYAPNWVAEITAESAFTLDNTTVPASTRTYLWDNFTADATENLCSTIWDDYRPRLSIPPEWSALKPATQGAFGQCAFYLNPDAFIDDPPKALVQATGIIKPSDPATTTANVPVTTEADPGPGSTPDPATPKETQMPSSNTDQLPQPTRQSEETAPLPVPGSPPNPTDPSSIPHDGENPDEENPMPILSPPVIATQARPTITGVVITHIDGQTLTAKQASPAAPVIIGSATLTIGQSTSYDGLGEVVVQASGLLVEGSVHPFSALAPAAVIVGAVLPDRDGKAKVAEQIDADGSVAVDGLVLEPGQSTTINGLGVLEIDSNGQIMVNGEHVPWSTINAMVAATTQRSLAARPTPVPFFTMGGNTYAAEKLSAFVVDGTTMTPGAIAMVDGTTVSLDASGGYVVVDGVTQSLAGSLTAMPISNDSPSHMGSDGGKSATSATGKPPVLVSSAESDLTNWVFVKLMFALLCYGFL